MPPPESDKARDAKAEALAFARGKAAAEVEAHLLEHDRHLKEINGSQRETCGRLEKIEERLVRIETSLTRAAGKAEAAAEVAATQVSTRQFAIGIGGLIVAIFGLIGTKL